MSTDKLWTVISGIEYQLNILKDKLKAYEETNQSVDEAYQRGLEDGKAQSERGCEGCKYDANRELTCPCFECSNNYKNKWTADKIEVGDEVQWKNVEDNDGKGIVLWTADNSVNGRKLCDIMSASGSARTWHTDEVVKTGRHFDIGKILEEMRS